MTNRGSERPCGNLDDVTPALYGFIAAAALLVLGLLVGVVSKEKA